MKQEKLEMLKKLFPQVIEEAKQVLKYYDECNVWFENGEWHVSQNIAIKSEYAEDHLFLGTIYQRELLSEEEIKKGIEELNKCQWF